MEETEQLFPRENYPWFSNWSDTFVVVNPEVMMLNVELHEEGNKKLHPCGICGRTFVLLRNLETHLITHTRDPLACEACGKTYEIQRYLQDHRAIEHGLTRVEIPPFVRKPRIRKTPAKNNLEGIDLKIRVEKKNNPDPKDLAMYKVWNF